MTLCKSQQHAYAVYAESNRIGICRLSPALLPPPVPPLLWHLPAGIAYWDVYKTAQLDVFKPKHAVTANASGGDGAGVQRSTAASSKASRVQHATHSAGKLPASFTSTSPKEQKLLAYIADFQRVFTEFYPHRYANIQHLCQHGMLHHPVLPLLPTAFRQASLSWLPATLRQRGLD